MLALMEFQHFCMISVSKIHNNRFSLDAYFRHTEWAKNHWVLGVLYKVQNGRELWTLSPPLLRIQLLFTAGTPPAVSATNEIWMHLFILCLLGVLKNQVIVISCTFHGWKIHTFLRLKHISRGLMVDVRPAIR